MNITTLMFNIADAVYEIFQTTEGQIKNRQVSGISLGGDAQFDIDDQAEAMVEKLVRQSGLPIALLTEAGKLLKYNDSPEHVLIIDPIDGTRPAAAGLEMACVSIAAAPYKTGAIIGDITHALLKELKTGAYLYSDHSLACIKASGYKQPIPQLNPVTDLANMFWSFEFNGHPTALMIKAYGNLIDHSANTGAVFIFNSASYSISRILTGQLDAYVDIGNRILRDQPQTRAAFLKAGNGAILHLFPYDIAASVYLAKKAGLICTDAYGNSLENVPLLSTGEEALRSCIAAANRELHTRILETIRWD